MLRLTVGELPMVAQQLTVFTAKWYNSKKAGQPPFHHVQKLPAPKLVELAQECEAMCISLEKFRMHDGKLSSWRTSCKARRPPNGIF